MTALLYFLVAVIAVSLATRAWLTDRSEPGRQAFLALGWSLGLSYSAFALSLLPGLRALEGLYMLAGLTVPATALWTLDRLFARDEGTVAPELPAVVLLTALVAPAATASHILLYDGVPRASPPEVVAGLLAAAGFGVALVRIWRAHEDAGLPVEKNRLRYLMVVTGGAVAFTLLEQLARALGPPVDPGQLSLASRGVALQGAIPPFSTVFTGLSVYFLYHSAVMHRLIDLRELFSRAATLLLSAGLLLLVDGITFMWVDTFTAYPFHSTFQIFLASLMFLAAYDPLRAGIAWSSNRVFNTRGQQLADSLANLRRLLPTLITTEALVDALLAQLHASGRVPECSIYLWSAEQDAFLCAGRRGPDENLPLQVVATHPFAEGFQQGAPWYNRSTVLRRMRSDPAQAEILGLMDAMNADVTLPFVSGGLVLGWLHLRDEGWSDGFSADELQRLQDLTQRASTVLANIQDFEALEEEHRLAAMGEMAAGLAHEIRNPLAGVLGAVQYLQAETFANDDAREMFQVIVDEVSRLDRVVTRFLDYARPSDLHREQENLNAVVTHALTLVRAQSLPPGTTLVEALSGELPTMDLDATRITQVLLNLIRNALEAMPEGGELRVETRRRALRDGQLAAELIVADTGSGISDEDLDKVFVPFFTTKRGGTGLGLAICQRIAQAHGGELDVFSRVGQGSRFVLRLPIHPGGRADPEADGGDAEVTLRAGEGAP